MNRKAIAQIMGKPQEYNGPKEFRYIESPIVKGQYIIKRPLGSMKELIGLTPREYIRLLIKHNGYITQENSNVVRFKTKEEALTMVELLNSMLVLHQMTKGE